MKDNANLTQAFEALKSVPDRDPAVVQHNRAAFLREAEQISQQPVSNSLFARLINNYRLSHTRMQFSTLTIGILLAVVMLTFSSGVYAARKSAPNQFLYPFKLWLEDSRLTLTNNPHEQIDLRLAYAEERLNEIEGFTGDAANPDLAAALKNFDDHYLILSEEDDLDDVQEQRWEHIQEEYQLIHPEDDEEGETEHESENQPDEIEQPEGQSGQDEQSGQDDEIDTPNNADAPVETGEDQPENNAEDTSSEAESDSSDEENTSDESEKDQDSGEKTPEGTDTPDSDSEDHSENSTEEPDPTPDDEPDPGNGSNND